MNAQERLDEIRKEINRLNRKRNKIFREDAVMVPITSGPDRGYSYPEWVKTGRRIVYSGLGKELDRLEEEREALKRILKLQKEMLELCEEWNIDYNKA